MVLIGNAMNLPTGRLLSLDLGQARHGVAVCDEGGMLATPLTTLARSQTRAADFAAIDALVSQERAVGVLVGLPGSHGDELSTQARWTRRYAGRLAGYLTVPMAFWDETLSSHDALQLPSVARGRTSVDAAAAAFILESFLDARRTAADRVDVAPDPASEEW